MSKFHLVDSVASDTAPLPAGPLEPEAAPPPAPFIPPFLQALTLPKPTFSDVFVVDADEPLVNFVKALSAAGLTIINHDSQLVITSRPRAWLR